MFLGWLYLAFIAVALIAVFFMAPAATQAASSAGLNDFSYPTASSDRVIPEIYGTVELTGNVLWYGDLSAEEIKKEG